MDYMDYEEEGISLKELLLVLIKGKKTIALITAVVLVLTALGSVILPNIQIGTQGEVETAVKLYFSGIEKGLRPDGSTYDVNEIKSAEILQEAVDQISLSHRPSISKLSANISFQAVLPDDAAKTLDQIKDLKTEELKLERLESLEIHPDTYIIKLNVSNDLGITKEEGREILDYLVLEYRNWLTQKYSGYTVLSDLFAEDFSLDQYDYIQAADILDGQLDAMESYINLNLSGRDFSSPRTGYSIEDLKDIIQSVRSLEMEQLYTKIAAFHVTKDAGKSVAIYESMAEKKEKQAAQRSEEAAALKDAVVNFKANEQTLVLGTGSEEPVKLRTESEQYNSFISQYIEAGAAAKTAEADALYYRNEAERFRQMAAAGVSLPASGADVVKETEDLIGKLKVKISFWTGIINETVEDYYATVNYQKYAEQLVPARSYDLGDSVNLPLNMAIGLVLGIVLGVLVVLFQAYLKEDGEQAKEKKENKKAMRGVTK